MKDADMIEDFNQVQEPTKDVDRVNTGTNQVK